MGTYPFQPVANTASIEMIFSSNGGKCENVFHVEGGVPFDTNSLATVATAFVDWWDTYLKSLVSTNVTLLKVVAKALDTDSSPAIEYTSGLPLTGTLNADALPSNVTLAVKWTSGLAGRSYRGRTYHIGLVASQVNGDTVLSTPLASLTDAYQSLISAVSDADAELVVVSRYHDNTRRTSGVTTPIIGCSVENNLDSQRRRLTGRGE